MMKLFNSTQLDIMLQETSMFMQVKITTNQIGMEMLPS